MIQKLNCKAVGILHILQKGLKQQHINFLGSGYEKAANLSQFFLLALQFHMN